MNEKKSFFQLQIDKLWLPKTPLTISFYKSDDKLILNAKDSTKTFVFKINSMSIVLYVVTLYSSVYKSILSNLENSVSALYPLTSWSCIYKSIGQNVTEVSFDNLNFRHTPRSVILCMVKTKNFLGKYDKNGFLYEHNNIQSVTLKSGQDEIIGVSEKLNIPKGQYGQAYNRMLNMFDGCEITVKEWSKFYFFLCYR